MGGCSRPHVGLLIHRSCACRQRPFARLFVTHCTRLQCRADRNAVPNTHSPMITVRRFGHHIGQRGAALSVVQALRCASTRCAGLRAWTTPARRSKCSIHVMAEEPLRFPSVSILTGAAGGRYVVGVSPVPSRTPPQSHPTRSAAAAALRATLAASLPTNSIARVRTSTRDHRV